MSRTRNPRIIRFLAENPVRISDSKVTELGCGHIVEIPVTRDPNQIHCKECAQ